MSIRAGSDDSTSVLTLLREHRSCRDQAEIDMIHDIIDWCVIHQTEDEGAASFGDHGIPLAGDGVPWVLEFAVMELSAALGHSTDSGKRYIGCVLETRYRLPKIWARVAAGDLPFWKARTIAEQTMSLPEQGAKFVDRHLAHVAHRVSFTQLRRLVEEALTRFDPVEAEKLAQAAADGRHLTVHTRGVGVNGMVELTGTLDLRDALDLDDALNAGAVALGAAGCTESHDVRRTIAAGDLARGHQPLDLHDTTETIETLVEVRAKQASKPSEASSIVLHVHLAEATLNVDTDGCLARVENTRSPIWADRIREWCANPHVHVTVRPVIDLAEHIHVEAYEIPERLRIQRELIGHHCVFPWCTRPARTCDLDHNVPHDKGGITCSCNTAPLCRGHHRAKTHSGWTYDTLDNSTYLWRSPHGNHYRRDHHGTTEVTLRPGEP